MMLGKAFLRNQEVKKIRERLDLTREDMAAFLAMSGLQSYKNMETGGKGIGKLTMKLLRYIDALPKQRALDFVEEFNKHQAE